MKYLILAFTSILFINIGLAQETTIYNSPHDFETSKKRLLESIKSQGFDSKLIRQRPLKVEVGGEIVQIIHFEFENDAITSGIVSCEPTAFLDMPFKMVLWEESGQVFIGYVDTIWLRRRFLIKGCDESLSEYSRILIRIANLTIKER